MMDNNTVSSIQSTSSHRIIIEWSFEQFDVYAAHLFKLVPSFDINIIQAECAKG